MNIDSVVEVKPNSNIPTLSPGDRVKVSSKVVEGDKERTQQFEGVVIKIQHGGRAGATFTVRRVTFGIGVERTFPLYSPTVEKVQVLRHGKVRRAKLYYLRGLSARASRLKEKREELGGVAIGTAETTPGTPEVAETTETTETTGTANP